MASTLQSLSPRHLAPLAAAVGLVLAGLGCQSAVAPEASPQRLSHSAEVRWQHDTLYYLASPQMQGRGPDTDGLNRAGEFIAEQFKRNGLEPAGTEGYFQPFDFPMGVMVDESTNLTIGGKALKLNDTFRPNSISSRQDAYSGDVVFAGYGITSASRGYDDYAGIDAKGKVVVIMRFEPRDAQGMSRFATEKVADNWSNEAGLARKILNAQSKGAKAVILVNPPGTTEDTLAMFGGRGPSIVKVPVVQVTRDALDGVLPADKKLTTLAAAIDADGRPAPVELPGLTASGQSSFRPKVAKVRNVMAILRGVGPHADEYVVVGAHYDHVGMGGMGSLAPGVNAVHPGADDNGSGTTAMMSLMKRITADARAGKPPERTILFQAYSVEEQGLIGSKYWVDHPTIGLDKIAYMLNLDMVGRLRRGEVLHGGSGTAETLPAIVDNAFAKTGLTSKSMGKGGTGPSDHESFSGKKIPVVFLFTGLHGEYHRPADKPNLINYEGMSQVVDLAESILKDMLVAAKVPYDSRFDADGIDLSPGDPSHGMSLMIGDAPKAPPSSAHASPSAASPTPAMSAPPADPTREQVGLGLRPDYAEAGKGMRVDGVTKNSAAEVAGIQAGDFITEIDGFTIASVQDLQAVYDRHTAGDKVTIKFTRDGKAHEAQATFRRRGGGRN